jgi:hypothetical protein
VKADSRFRSQPKVFWSYVRLLSQHCGYTQRGTGQIKVLALTTLTNALSELGLATDPLQLPDGTPTRLGKDLVDYFAYRAEVLNSTVEPLLMDADEAERVYSRVRRQSKVSRAAVMNKQKGDKKKPAFLTEIVRTLIETEISGAECDFDPRELTAFTRDGAVVRTLSRRVDGAFPSPLNPIAIWEIKEYYHTTTFGSRVADGVYETQLDGMELEDLRASESINCDHILFIDSRYTWWECGRSYLCRIIDMLNMGLVGEVVFGKEALERAPLIAREWLRRLKSTSAARR